MLLPFISYSLPSTHTAMAIAAALVLFTVNWRLGVAALVLALLVSFSRVYLLVHYVSDVLAGMAVGVLVAILAVIIIRKLSEFAEKRWQWMDNTQ